MTSKEPCAPLDLEKGLKLSRQDLEALRRSQPARPMSPAEFLAFLSGFTFSPASLRERREPRGDEPFLL